MAAHARTFDREKALEAILYIAHKLHDPTFHSISKMFYLSDKCHLQHYGRLICGDRYIAMEYGPVPSAAYNMMKTAAGRETVDADWDDLIKESFRVRSRWNVQPLREPDMDVLAASEVECMDQTIEMHGGKSFGQLTDMTHDDAWKSADENQPISVQAIAGTLPNATELVSYLREP